MKVKLSHSAKSDSLQLHGLHSPRNSPGPNTGVGSCSLLQGNLPNPVMKPRSPTLPADSLPAEPPGKPIETDSCIYVSKVCDYNLSKYEIKLTRKHKL